MPEIAASPLHMIEPTDDHQFMLDGPATLVIVKGIETRTGISHG
jgi:hypothetical protein